MQNIDLIATATFGVESIVAQELKNLGYKELKISNGKVEFRGEIKDICKTNLWLRCADRVLLKVAEFKAVTFDELFDYTKSICWGDIIPKDAKFPVAKISSVNSRLFSKSDCQAIVKKAIVESLKNFYGISALDETGDEYSIKIELLNDMATLSIDTSGSALHKRGYRAYGNQAPIKETLAAALIKLAKWKEDSVLIDPFCGTGTILIEAAMIAKNIAPGINRHFISENWSIISKNFWTDAKNEATEMKKDIPELKIYGSDIDEKVLKIARQNIKLAGLENCIFIQKLPVKEIASRFKYGSIISNPPYGERSFEKKEVEKLYREMGKIFTAGFDTWSYYIITANTDFEKLFGRKANKNRKLYNGGIKCYFYQYYGPKLIHKQ